MWSLARTATRSSLPLFLLLVPVPVFATPTLPTSDTQTVTAFVNVNLVPMDHDGVVREQTVLVRGATISEIGPTSAIHIPASAIVIDGTGQYLLPGLADMHVHLNSYVHARPNFGDAPVFLAYGITTVLNLSGDPDLLACRQRIRNGELLAPNLYTSGEFINEPRERTPEEVEREVLKQFRDGYDVIKFHQIVDADGRYITTSGLSRAAYMRMNEVARQLGIPLLGHAPVYLGLNTLLEAHQSLAHVGEFVPLYFLPPDPKHMNQYLLVSAGMVVVLFASCAWLLVAEIVQRARKVGPAPSPVLRLGRMIFAVTAVALLSIVLSIVLILSGNALLLTVATISFLVLLVLTVTIGIATERCWRVSSVASKLHFAVVTFSAVAFVAATAYWLPILWRSNDAEIVHLAESARRSGISVETTLNLYDAVGMSRQQRMELLQEPAFKALAPDIRDDWAAIAGQDLLPKWQMMVFRNYPEFTRKLTSSLHKAGVPLLLGTDALGAPLAIPGASAHQELQLLVVSGLTPYEALRTTTINAAKFLGKEDEFGTIAVGKRADLLLVSADPLVDIHTLKKPVGVMVSGHWLAAEKLQEMLGALANQT